MLNKKLYEKIHEKQLFLTLDHDLITPVLNEDILDT